MKRIIVFGLVFVLFCCASSLVLVSCQNKKVILPQAKETIVAEVKDQSPVYLFFRTEEKDTLIEIKISNSINSGNRTFNIDKRLSLRKVILEIKKIQANKEGSMHKSKTLENYFAYADTVRKSVAYLPFTKVKYKLEYPSTFHVYINKYGLVRVGSDIFSRNELQDFLEKAAITNKMTVKFAYDKQMSFGKYIETKLFVKNLILKNGISINHNLDYIY